MVSKISKNSKTVELRTRKIVEHNNLISSVAKMDKTPLKIFELAVSCIDTENPPKDDVVFLSKTELFSYFKVSDRDKHSRFKEAIKKMQEQAFFNIREETDEGIAFESIVPVPYIKWTNYDDNVKIRFSPEIMPYLINMKSNFTQYALSDIMDLNSKYAIIIYKWLCMFYNQFEHYEFSNNRTQKQLEEYRNPIIKLSELRMLTDTVNEYPIMNNFTKRVLEQATKEINAHTHFNVTYEKIKSGKKIDSIQFHISKKKQWKDENYKRDNTVAQLSVEQKEQKKKKMAGEAAIHQYTSKLLATGLLRANDITDQNTLILLSSKVYPLYDKLVEQSGTNRLDEHLNYVRDKMKDYTTSKRNIAKYLASAVSQII